MQQGNRHRKLTRVASPRSTPTHHQSKLCTPLLACAGTDYVLVKYSDNGMAFLYNKRLSVYNLGHEGVPCPTRPQVQHYTQSHRNSSVSASTSTSTTASTSAAATPFSQGNAIYGRYGQGTWQDLASLSYQSDMLVKHMPDSSSNSSSRAGQSANGASGSSSSSSKPERFVLVMGQVMQEESFLTDVSRLCLYFRVYSFVRVFWDLPGRTNYYLQSNDWNSFFC